VGGPATLRGVRGREGVRWNGSGERSTMTTTSRKDRTLAISVTQASRRFFKLSGSSNKRGTPPAKDTSGGDYSADSLNSNPPVNPLPPREYRLLSDGAFCLGYCKACEGQSIVPIFVLIQFGYSGDRCYPLELTFAINQDASNGSFINTKHD